MNYQLELTARDVRRLLFELRARRGLIQANDAWLSEMIDRLTLAERTLDRTE